MAAYSACKTKFTKLIGKNLQFIDNVKSARLIFAFNWLITYHEFFELSQRLCASVAAQRECVTRAEAVLQVLRRAQALKRSKMNVK